MANQEVTAAHKEVENVTDTRLDHVGSIDQAVRPSISVGWLDNWVDSDVLGSTSVELSRLIKDIERDAVHSQELLLAQKDLRKGIREISELIAKDRLLPQQLDASSLKSRLVRYYRKASDFSEKTCQVLLHYQQVFDVFKEQAPEYVTAIWGAVKLLLLVVSNKTHIREQIERNLIDFVGKFQLLDIITKFPPSQDVQKAITDSVQVFLTFLTKSMQFMKKNGFRQAFNGLVKPWQIQFEPLVGDVNRAILRARELAQVHFERNTGLLVHATYRGQQTLGQAILEFAKKLDLRSDTLEDSMQTLIRLVETRDRPSGLPSSHELKAIKEEAENKDARREGLELVGHDEKTVFRQTQKGVPITALVQQGRGTHFECFEQVFPKISVYDLQSEVFSRYYLYHRREGKADMDTLRSLEQERRVQGWLSGPSSAILWVYGHRRLTPFDWMTRFALRVLYPTVIDDYQPQPQQQSSAFFTLHIFCGLLLQSSPSHKLSICGILQSFIVQAFTRLWSLEDIRGNRTKIQSIKSRNDCQDLGLVLHRLEDGKDSPLILFEILSSLLRLLGSTCVFIVMDGIHHLKSEGMQDSKLTSDFHQLLSSLAELTADNDFIVKTLITSRAPFTSDLMAAEVARFDVKFYEVKVDRQAAVTSRTASRVVKRRVILEQENKTDEAHQKRVQESLEAGDDTILDLNFDQSDLPGSGVNDSDSDSLCGLDGSDSDESVHFTSDEEGDGERPATNSDRLSESDGSDDGDGSSEATPLKLHVLKKFDSLEDLMADSLPASPVIERGGHESSSDLAAGDDEGVEAKGEVASLY